MTESSKNLKKLGRTELLELLVEHSKEIERLKVALDDAMATCVDLEFRCDELEERNAELEQGCVGVGSVSDEAMRLFMAGANQAVEEIVAENKACADAIISDARREAEAIVTEAEEEAAVIRKYAKMLLVDARDDAASVSAAAQSSSDELMAETRRICSDLLGQAKAEIDALFDEADSRAAGRWRR